MNKVAVSVVVFCIMNAAVVCGMDENSATSSHTLSGWFKKGLNVLRGHPVMSHQDYMRTTEEHGDGDYQVSADKHSKRASSPISVSAASIPPKGPENPGRRHEKKERVIDDTYGFIQDLLNHV